MYKMYLGDMIQRKRRKYGVPFNVMEVLMLHLEPRGSSLPFGGWSSVWLPPPLPLQAPVSPGSHASGPRLPHLDARRWVSRQPQSSVLSPEPTVVADTPRALLHRTDLYPHMRTRSRLAYTPVRGNKESTPKIRLLYSISGKTRFLEEQWRRGECTGHAGVGRCVAPHDEERSYSLGDQWPCAARASSPRCPGFRGAAAAMPPLSRGTRRPQRQEIAAKAKKCDLTHPSRRPALRVAQQQQTSASYRPEWHWKNSRGVSLSP